ncbi:MAG: hypothetical protein LBK95_19150 [Bifidobacteriaceae bacterium]|nr:hypothetical protein [Bifidobacteriaceae bacterium]
MTDRRTTTITVSMPIEVAESVRRVAGRGGVSEFMTEAARHRLHMQGLGELAADIAAKTGGPYTQEELAAIDRQWSTEYEPVAHAA